MTPRLPGDIVTISANLSGHGFPIGTLVLITKVDDIGYDAVDDADNEYLIGEEDIEQTESINPYYDSDPNFNEERGYNMPEGE